MFESLGRSCLKRTFLCLLFLTAFLLIASSVAPTASAEAADHAWSISSIGTSLVSSSIAVDSDGNPHVSYILSNDLYVAELVDGTWNSQLIDAASQCGYNTVIAIDSQGYTHIMYMDTTLSYAWTLMYANNVDGYFMIYNLGQTLYYGFDMTLDSNDKVHVAYHPQSANVMSYGTNAGGSWVFGTINDGSIEVYPGAEFSIATDSQNHPHIAAVTYTDPVHLIYASYDGSSWGVETPDGTTKTLRYLDLTIDSNDKAHMVYVLDPVRNVKYITNAGGSWASTVIEGTLEVTNQCVSIVTDPNDKVHITYIDLWPKHLHYVTNEGGSWTYDDLDLATWTDAYGDMVIDPDGNLHQIAMDSSFVLRYLYGEPPVRWAPSFDNAPADGRETQAYSFVPDLNETDAIITAHSTNAPFLSWNGTGYSGTPSTAQAGTYWISISAQSVLGTMTATQNETFVIGDTWGPSFTILPGDGQETVPYTYEPGMNETYTITAHSTNAPFLSWDGSRYTGTPGSADSGTYWINLTAQSTPGLMTATMNETFIIEDTWAPVPTAFPADGQETAYYEFRPAFNDSSAVIINMETNASFLELVFDDMKGIDYNGFYFAGTPGENDAGEYWINITAFSDDGLLYCYLNETFVIEDSYANHITNFPADGREVVYYQYNPTFDGAMTLIDWHSDADWMLLYGPLEKGPGFPNYWYGTPQVGDAGTYYLNITLQSIGGLLYTTHNFTFEVTISWAPSFENAPGDGRVNVPYEYEPRFNESDATVMSYITNATFLTWNGSAYAGTPGLGDAGTYWINISAYSPSGLLESFSNQSFEILPMPRSLRINSDADMLWAVSEFKWAGDGSEGDPFIVTGLVIDSLGLDENALFIGNVTYSFVVTGNDLSNAGPAGGWADARSASLYIYNCDGASVSNNRLWGSLFGLCLMGCSEISVDDNLVELNDYAGIVVLSGCQFISVENNTVEGNWGTYCIWVKAAAYVRMANNTLSSASNAVTVEDDGMAMSSFIIFRDNDIDDVWNGLVLFNVMDAIAVNNTFTNIDPSNSEAAIGVYSGQEMEISGNTIADGWYGIYLCGPTHVLLENNSISVDNIGVYMEYATNIYLANGSVSADTGVLADECYLCIIRGLDISGGTIGVNVYEGCDGVLVADCHLYQLFIGVKVYVALDTTVLNCTFTTTLGVEDDTSEGTTVSDCVFNGTTSGVYAYGSTGLMVESNTLTNCTNAIMLEDTVDSRISENTLSGNQADISLYTCSGITIDGNVIAGLRKEVSGISLSNCLFLAMYSNAIEDGAITFDIDFGSETVDSHIIADNNTVGGKPVYYYQSTDYGWLTTPDDGGQIIIASSTNLVVSGLQTTSCTAPVYIIGSVGIRIYDLELSGSGVGVTVLDSADIWIVDGSIDNMSIGILGLYVDDVLISGMSMSGNFDAIYVATSEFGPASSVGIEVCLIEGSRNVGITFDGVQSSSIYASVIANSTGYGVLITDSQNIMVVENFFYRNNGADDGYSVPTQAYADSDTNYFDNNGRGNYWSEQLGPDVDGDGIVDEFTYVVDGGTSADLNPLAFVFTTEPGSEARNRFAYWYDADADQGAAYGMTSDAGFLSIDPVTGNVTGMVDACGVFQVNVSATLYSYLTIWQNYTLTVNDTWAPEISGTPANGKETVDYAYEPSINETVTNVVAVTNAPFLSWNGTAFVGTPGQNDAGTYWINITATSGPGLLTGWYNATFVVEDSWAPAFEAAPGEGQETVPYAFAPEFNETVTMTGHQTNAPFLSWNGTAFIGTPGQDDAGEYWMNVTAVSAEGLLGSYQNSTFAIGDSWAPSFDNLPKDGQETVDYVFGPKFNESATVTGFETNAPFLSWNGSAYVGTPTVNDAGEYWMNITAVSDEGLLGSYQNSTFVIGDSWSPTFENAPPEGQETVEYAFEPQFNETVLMAGQQTNAPFLSWNGSAYVGTPTVNDAGEYWINVTALSSLGLRESWHNWTFVIGDSWAPQIVSDAVEFGRETLNYVYASEANETVVWSMNTDAPFLDWNGSAVVGLPNVTSAGTYYVNLTAVSVDGLLASWQNYTLTVNDTWAAEMTNGPLGGQETVEYAFEPQFNETVTMTGHQTNAPFLSWNGSAFVGTPTVADAGEYWMSITAASVPGLLDASWNLTFVIGEAWAPEIASEPPASGFWATLEYIYQLEANESVVFSLSTDADFLSLVNGTISGTMEEGTFFVNVTAVSVDGLLSSWQNFTLAVEADNAAPNVEVVSPIDGSRLNDTSVLLEYNITDDGSGVAGIWVKVDGGNWTAVSGTNVTLLLSGGEHNITVRSVDAVGNEAQETISVLIDLITPTVTSAAPQGEDVALDAPIVVTFSEAMDAGSVTISVNGQPATVTWNGSVATIVGDWEYDTEYTVVVNGQDLAGNAMDSMTFSFVTEEQLVTISGILLDEGGNPIANASISVDGTVVAVTGEDGSYSFLLVPGEYLVAISAEGYEDQATPLTVGTEAASLDVELHGIQEGSDGSLWWLALVMIAIILGLLYMIRRQF